MDEIMDTLIQKYLQDNTLVLSPQFAQDVYELLNCSPNNPRGWDDRYHDSIHSVHICTDISSKYELYVRTLDNERVQVSPDLIIVSGCMPYMKPDIFEIKDENGEFVPATGRARASFKGTYLPREFLKKLMGRKLVCKTPYGTLYTEKGVMYRDREKVDFSGLPVWG